MLNMEIRAREDKMIFNFFFFVSEPFCCMQSFEHNFVLYLLLCVYSPWTTTVKKIQFCEVQAIPL